MQKFKFILPLVLLIALIIFFWKGLQLNPHEIPSPLVGKPAPQFQAPSLFDAKKTFDEKVFRGHVSVFNVFATWCIACHAEHAILMQLHHDKPKVQMIGLAFKDHKKAVVDYLNKSGNPYSTVIDDKSGDVAVNFGIYGTPETFIIDAEGVIRSKIIGPISPEILKDQVLPMIDRLSRKP